LLPVAFNDEDLRCCWFIMWQYSCGSRASSK